MNIPTDSLLRETEAARARQLAGKAPAGEKERQAAKKVGQEFEALFVGMMLKSMRETVGKDSLAGGGRGEELFRSMLDQEYANAFAARGGLGLAAVIEKQLVREPAETSGTVNPENDSTQRRKDAKTQRESEE